MQHKDCVWCWSHWNFLGEKDVYVAIRRALINSTSCWQSSSYLRHFPKTL